MQSGCDLWKSTHLKNLQLTKTLYEKEKYKNGHKPFAALSLVAALTTALSSQVLAETYDLVINNGRVIDPETLFDDVANVGIKDGRIVEISKKALKGTETMDATGQIVAPGFIDTHFHFQMPIGYSLGLRDGLTSSMDFEMGCAGSYVARWYEDRAGKTQANYGIAVSHEFARAMFIDGSDGDYLKDGPIAAFKTRAKTGWSATRPTLEQGNAILEEIDKGLQAGAVGIGSTVGYMREGVSSREMFEVQKVGARYGRPTGAHTRYTLGTDTTENNGAQELVANALALGAPAIVLHFNNDGWRLAHEMIIRLQEQGHNIWGEVYPYAAGSTTINASFLEPKSWIDVFGRRYEDTMLDPVTGKYYTLETYKATVASEPTRPIVIFKQPEEDQAKWLTLKGVTMASDAVGCHAVRRPVGLPDGETGRHPSPHGWRPRRYDSPRSGKQHPDDAADVDPQLQRCQASGRYRSEVHARARPHPDWHGCRYRGV